MNWCSRGNTISSRAPAVHDSYRDGKTLLVDTLKCLFEGRRELFKGLWIEDKYDWTVTHPVIKINFNDIEYHNHDLKKGLNAYMDAEAKRHGHTLAQDTPGEKLKELIELLSTPKQKVVMLIDEYDKPITDFLDNLPTARITATF